MSAVSDGCLRRSEGDVDSVTSVVFTGGTTDLSIVAGGLGVLGASISPSSVRINSLKSPLLNTMLNHGYRSV